jgi:hypothetical protein
MATLSRIPSPILDPTGSKKPYAIYDGGYEDAKVQGVRLRVATGSAGQQGFLHVWADEFIRYMVSEGMLPFEVDLLTYSHIFKI